MQGDQNIGSIKEMKNNIEGQMVEDIWLLTKEMFVIPPGPGCSGMKFYNFVNAVKKMVHEGLMRKEKIVCEELRRK